MKQIQICIIIAAFLLFAIMPAQATTPANLAIADSVSYPPSITVPFSGDATFFMTIDATIYWGTAYYLDNGRWVGIQLPGTSIAGTNWKRGGSEMTVSIPASALADEQNLIVLVYYCDRVADRWQCSTNANGNPAWAYINIALEELPLPPGPEPPGACGDNICDAEETATDCPADCGGYEARTYILSGGETASIVKNGITYQITFVGALNAQSAVVKVGNEQKTVLQGSSGVFGRVSVFVKNMFFLSTTDQTLNSAELVFGQACTSDTQCPSGYQCYYSVSCGGPPAPNTTAVCSEGGDNMCHRRCTTNADCVAGAACNEVTIWSGDAGLLTKMCFAAASNNRGCTKDARICPDGSVVGRIPPSCEFPPCPESTNETYILHPNQNITVEFNDVQYKLSLVGTSSQTTAYIFVQEMRCTGSSGTTVYKGENRIMNGLNITIVDVNHTSTTDQNVNSIVIAVHGAVRQEQIVLCYAPFLGMSTTPGSTVSFNSVGSSLQRQVKLACGLSSGASNVCVSPEFVDSNPSCSRIVPSSWIEKSLLLSGGGSANVTVNNINYAVTFVGASTESTGVLKIGNIQKTVTRYGYENFGSASVYIDSISYVSSTDQTRNQIKIYLANRVYCRLADDAGMQSNEKISYVVVMNTTNQDNSALLSGGETTSIVISGITYIITLVGAPDADSAVVKVTDVTRTIRKGTSSNFWGLDVYVKNVNHISTTDQTLNNAELVFSANCPRPYHVLSNGYCVWSCSQGTTPDMNSNECICQPGYAETGTDFLGRRVCNVNTTNTTLQLISLYATPLTAFIGQIVTYTGTYSGDASEFQCGILPGYDDVCYTSVPVDTVQQKFECSRVVPTSWGGMIKTVYCRIRDSAGRTSNSMSVQITVTGTNNNQTYILSGGESMNITLNATTYVVTLVGALSSSSAVVKVNNEQRTIWKNSNSNFGGLNVFVSNVYYLSSTDQTLNSAELILRPV